MDHDINQTRRAVLQKAGLSVGAIVGGSGVVSANDDRGDQSGSLERWLEVTDDRFVIDLDGTGLENDYRITLRETVRGYNNAIEAGYIALEGEESTSVTAANQSSGSSLTIKETATVADLAAVQVESGAQRTRDRRRTAGSTGRGDTPSSGVESQSCNKNTIEVERYGGLIPGEYMVSIYLSNDTIRDVEAIQEEALAGGGALWAALKRYGVIPAAGTILSSAAVAAISAVLVAEWAWIAYSNAGCGVKINTGFSPVNPTYVVPTVEAQ